MKDLEYRNSVDSVQDELRNFFIQKFFRLNNLRDRIISQSNQILNFQKIDESFIVYKEYKLNKIATEIEFTLKRIIRLFSKTTEYKKDNEFYLQYFKLKKLDSVFIKPERDFHHSLRKDDFEVYYRQRCYYDRITSHIRTFEPYIRLQCLKQGVEIWKNSKLKLSEYRQTVFDDVMARVKTIYTAEKVKINANHLKIFKEYFKGKYKFYYDLKEVSQNPEVSIYQSSNYDLVFPPLIITINSEIKHLLKEICDYFQIAYDIGIDKGKAFSYSIDLFYPVYFNHQSKNFIYNDYELTLSEMLNTVIDTYESEQNVNIETKQSLVLRTSYDVNGGFVVNPKKDNNFLDTKFKNISFISENYIKKAKWVGYLCMNPKIDKKYMEIRKHLDTISSNDSMMKYEMELIDVVDLNTFCRLVDDYVINISTRVTNTISLIYNVKRDESNHNL